MKMLQAEPSLEIEVMSLHHRLVFGFLLSSYCLPTLPVCLTIQYQKRPDVTDLLELDWLTQL